MNNLKFYKKEDKYHYGIFIGSFNFWRIVFWNLIHPKRFLNRLRYRQLFRKKNTKTKMLVKSLIKDSQKKSNYSNEMFVKKFEEYIDNGGVVLDNYFPPEKIDAFLNKYKLIIEELKNIDISNQYDVYKRKFLFLSKELNDIWLDDNLLKFLSCSMGGKAYCREYPIMIFSRTNNNSISSKDSYEKKIDREKVNSPSYWHVDHSLVTNLHILLEDLTVDDNHMEYLPGSNRYLNFSDLYSDENVQRFKKKPIQCIGKKGTIYFHQANTLHRLKNVPGKMRLNLILSFTPGGKVEISCKNIAECLSHGFDLESLNDGKREFLKGIFPKSFKKGIDIIKDDLTPARLDGS